MSIVTTIFIQSFLEPDHAPLEGFFAESAYLAVVTAGRDILAEIVGQQ